MIFVFSVAKSLACKAGRFCGGGGGGEGGECFETSVYERPAAILNARTREKLGEEKREGKGEGKRREGGGGSGL